MQFVKEPIFSENELLEVLNSFVGKSVQIPPKYSAIKKNGKKLCDLARSENEINIEEFKREIEIYSIELLQFNEYKAKIKVFCKKGTYIRSLVNDIGLKLGCGAYMNDLIRTKAGKFDIDLSDSLESDSYKEISPLKALPCPKINLTEEQYLKVKNGNFIQKPDMRIDDYVLLTKDNKLVSIAYLSDNLIKPKKFFGEV